MWVKQFKKTLLQLVLFSHVLITSLEAVRLYLEQQKLDIGGKNAFLKQVNTYQVQFIQIFHDHTPCTKYTVSIVLVFNVAKDEQ